MATVTRKICDVDQRDEDVVSVLIEVDGKGGTVDMCAKCLASIPVGEAAKRGEKQIRRRRDGFVKVELPPQP